MPSVALTDRLGYVFRDAKLLAQALTHRSHAAVNNERLEFIGDAVLDCVIAAALYDRFPAVSEGDLSRIRAHLVNRETLARLARDLELGTLLQFGKGARKSGDADRPWIVADALEAVFGAVFVDGGFASAREVILAVFAQDLASADPATLGKDPKTRLQEWLQARALPVPEYVVVGTTGAGHAQSFTIECRVPSLGVVTSGSGSSRRAAEQAAATLAGAQVNALAAAVPARG